MIVTEHQQDHLDEFQDSDIILNCKEQPSSSCPTGQETPTPPTHSTFDKANISLIKRKAILLLSEAHKSENACDRRMATSLLAELYKVETEQDMAKLQMDIQQLLQRKQQQEDAAAMATKRKLESEPREGFSRIRATWNRLVFPNSTSLPSTVSTKVALTSSKRQLFTRKQEIADNSTKWKMFWQSEPPPEPNHGTRTFSLGLHGIEESSASGRYGRPARRKLASRFFDSHSV
eukprot:scaffold10700_cov108-Cylindrotheca_fusiformis.AAC.9